jgi:hypothetical protein
VSKNHNKVATRRKIGSVSVRSASAATSKLRGPEDVFLCNRSFVFSRRFSIAEHRVSKEVIPFRANRAIRNGSQDAGALAVSFVCIREVFLVEWSEDFRSGSKPSPPPQGIGIKMADESNVESVNGTSVPLKESLGVGTAPTSDTGTAADPGSIPAPGPPDVEPYDQEGEDDPDEDVDAVSCLRN